jgi:hypothetical protein
VYPHHKAYARDRLLVEKPEMGPRELAAQMGISFGEALVILREIKVTK